MVVKGEEKKEDADSKLIFCIDLSGSMSSTVEVPGKIEFKHGLTEEEYKMLKDFIEPGAEMHQQLPHQNYNTTWISRKQCVVAAIEKQLQEMKASNPNKKVGLITYNNEVLLIGDGLKVPETIAGDKLNSFDVKNLWK